MKIYRVIYWFLFAFISLIYITFSEYNEFYGKSNVPYNQKPITLDKFKEKINESSLQNGEDYYDILDKFDDLYKEKYCKVNDSKSFCYVRLINSNDYKKLFDIYFEEFVLNDVSKNEVGEKKFFSTHYKRDELFTPKGNFIIIYIDDVVIFNIYPENKIDYVFLDSIGYYDLNPQKQSDKSLKTYIQIVIIFVIIYLIL